MRLWLCLHENSSVNVSKAKAPRIAATPKGLITEELPLLLPELYMVYKDGMVRTILTVVQFTNFGQSLKEEA